MLTLNEILTSTKGKLISGNTKNIQAGKICLDSRKIEKNDIFIAHQGKNINSNNYIKNIIKIASIIITEKDIKSKSKTPIIKVDNYKQAIKEIGVLTRQKYINKPLIAITGSVGKTTTKDLLAQILEKKYKILKTEGNLNNDIGVPLTLSRIKEETDIIILEIGMNHLNEIKELSNISKPNIAIITNIGTSHIGNLKSQKNILKAKSEITSGMNHGILILNGNDKYLKKIKEKNQKIIKTNTKEITNIECKETLKFKINNLNITFPIPNTYLINNILLDIKVAELFNIEKKDIIDAIKNYKTSENRINIIKLKNNITLINDCYNASLESLKSTLSMIRENNLLILGDILELGKYTKKIHKKIQKEIKKIPNTKTISVGKYTKKIGIHFNNNQEIINYLKKQELKNITILIKGSRKMKLEEIKDYLVKNY